MDKAKCLFCNYWVAKNKFDRHTTKCVKRTQVCNYCRTPSHKSDMPAHEKRCMQKYQYIKNAEGSKFCKICKRTFANRTNAMIHMVREKFHAGPPAGRTLKRLLSRVCGELLESRRRVKMYLLTSDSLTATIIYVHYNPLWRKIHC